MFLTTRETILDFIMDSGAMTETTGIFRCTLVSVTLAVTLASYLLYFNSLSRVFANLAIYYTFIAVSSCTEQGISL